MNHLIVLFWIVAVTNGVVTQARYNHALKLMRAGRHRDAAPHFALAAASCQPELRTARTLLAGVCAFLTTTSDIIPYNILELDMDQ